MSGQWRILDETTGFVALPSPRQVHCTVQVLRVHDAGEDQPMLADSQQGRQRLVQLIADQLRAEASQNDPALRRDRVQHQADDSQRDLDRATAQVQALDGKRRLAVLDAAPGLAAQLRDIDVQLNEWSVKRSNAQASVDTLNSELATIRGDADRRQRELDPNALAHARTILAGERKVLLDELLATAGPILDRILAVDCGWQASFTAGDTLMAEAHRAAALTRVDDVPPAPTVPTGPAVPVLATA